MKYAMKLLLLLPALNLMAGAADGPAKVDSMDNLLPAVTCLQVPDDYLKQSPPPENSQTLVFDDPARLTKAENWRGKEDFSVRVTFGWNHDGLCFFFDVKDSDLVCEKEKNVDLWMQDSVELFIAAPEGKKFGNNTLSFERFQLILSPPDAAGKFRSFTLYDGAYGPDIRYEASGERTGDGYRIRLLIPYGTFGNYDLRRDGEFRMQFSCNDYDRRDGNCLPPRKVSINRAPQPSASAEDYPLFRLCRSDADNPKHSLETVWNPVAPRLAEADSLTIAPELPNFLEHAELSVQDLSGRELQHEVIPPGTEILTLTDLSKLGSVGLRFVFTGYVNGKAYGSVTRNSAQIAGLLRVVDAVKWDRQPPWRTSAYLAMVSAIEFLRLAATPGSLNNNRMADAIAECEARLALLEGRPFPADLPARYRYLELTRGFEAQLNVAYSRGGRPNERIFAAISLPWGNIPCVNAELYGCDNIADAEKLIAEMTAYCTPFAPPAIAGADTVYAGRGHLLSDGLRSDMEPERLLSLYASSRPRHVFRMTPEDAFRHPVDAVIVMPDSPEPIKKQLLDFAASRKLPVIPFARKGNFRYSLIAGTPDYPEIAWFWHSRNGLPSDFLIVRRGADVIRCGYGDRELGKTFMEFILAGKPITRPVAEQFARRRAASMPAPQTADFKAAGELRTGDVHTHTIFSDGQSTPAGLLAAAPAAGFDFLVISDHDEVEGALRLAENMRRHNCHLPLFAGQEITMAPRYHINVYPIPQRIDDRFSWPAIRAAARKFGAVTQLNHPMTYGTGFSKLWYGDISLAGFDAIERRVEYLEKWRRSAAGRIPAVTGSTDTHIGIFGYSNCTTVIAPDFSGKALADAVRAGRSAMIDPFLPEPACGDPAVCRAVAAALLDPETPQRFGRRLNAALAGFDAAGFLADSETAPALPAPPPRPRESFDLEPPETLELDTIPENKIKTGGHE